MAGILGQVSWGFVPLNWTGQNLRGSFPSPSTANNYLCSANDPLRYQVQWTGLREDENASASNYVSPNGDLIRVTFTVSVSVDNVNFETIAVIKKLKDLPNRHYETGNPANIQRFTIDVSSIVSDELSYSLCPINKGTWQSNSYGGMNGGAVMQDNVLGNSGAMGNLVSNYNVSKNGSYRILRVKPTFETIHSDGRIIEAAGTTLSHAPTIVVINSVSQFGIDNDYFSAYALRNGLSNGYFLTRNPYEGVDMKKPVGINEKAEFLQFQLYTADYNDINGTGKNHVGSMGFEISTYNSSDSLENTFYIRDFEDNLKTELDSTIFSGSGGSVLTNAQYQNCIQNLSPSYIKDKATKYSAPDGSDTVFPYWNSYSGDTIRSTTAYYKVHLVRFGVDTNTKQKSSIYKYYLIDREDDNLAYGFVRFHWLNCMGGIDSYTAKRDVSEGLTISRDVVERKSVDRRWVQDDDAADGAYISDTMRGGNFYKGGREVSNVNAERNLSVYTEPLNKVTAEWLEEMMLSTNVWVEMETDATTRSNSLNSYLRPDDLGYIPVIITNNDVEIVNQEQGLVKFNIEYTLAHKVRTQRT